MPALDYDYDYYEYKNGHRVNRNVNVRTNAKSNVSYGTNVRRSNNSSNNKSVKSTTSKNVKSVSSKNQTNYKRNNVTTQKQVAKKSKQSIDIPIQTSTKIKNKPDAMTLKAPKTKQKKSAIVELKTVALISVFFALFFMICYRYSVLNEEFSGIKKLQTQLVEAQAVNDQLQAEIESKTDLTYVENYAKYQLGMQKPSASQIQYVNVEKQDKITKPVTIEDEEELSWFENLVREIRKIID